jgi:hypothetical protein
VRSFNRRIPKKTGFPKYERQKNAVFSASGQHAGGAASLFPHHQPGAEGITFIGMRPAQNLKPYHTNTLIYHPSV